MAKKPTDEKKQDVPNPRKGGSHTVQPDGSLKKNKPNAAAPKPPAKPKPSADESDGGESGGN